MHRHFIHGDVVPFQISESATTSDLVQRMAGTAFQGRMIGHAVRVWQDMLSKDVTIFLGLSGAMVPAGMRTLLVYLIENRLIDCLVSTGANLYHDVYETLGYGHWQTTPEADDDELAQEGYYRFYDVLALEKDFLSGESFIADFGASLDPEHAYPTREFFDLLGRALIPLAKEEGILTAAAKAGVPIYCPALSDSAIGMGLADLRGQKGHKVFIDVIRDAMELAWMCLHSPATGAVIIGGGTPKNFVQEAAVGGSFFRQPSRGHSFGIQITTDAPQWGGLSGSTFQEAKSWKKYGADAHFVTVNVDATVALPIMVSALAQGSAEIIKARKQPSFSFDDLPGS